MKFAFMALVIGLFTAPICARADSAEEMVSNCRDVAAAKVLSDGTVMVPQDFDSGMCWGAFTSFNKATHIVDEKRKPFFGICYPPDVSISQEIKVFLAYVDKHPEKLNEDYFFVALTANREAFPCSP
jgi:Rap1a immunity proteins